MNLFTGLSAFPLTPLADDVLDERAFAGLIERLAAAGVDSITVLGSTGSYAYLSAEERARAARLAVAHAVQTPVFVGVGALRTSQVLANAERAEASGAAGLLLAPMTYQPLTEDDVLGLFRALVQHTELPVILYDNPSTTGFTFSTELYGRIAALPGIASIKIPPPPLDPAAARARIEEVRDTVPDHVTVGVSGDPAAATGLLAGADAWYSVIAGTLPAPALDITRAAQQGRIHDAQEQSRRLTPLWDLFAQHGSLRVVASIAEHLGLVPRDCLPLPIRPLPRAERDRILEVVEELGFG